MYLCLFQEQIYFISFSFTSLTHDYRNICANRSSITAQGAPAPVSAQLGSAVGGTYPQSSGHTSLLECNMRVIVRMNVSLTISGLHGSDLWSIIPNKCTFHQWLFSDVTTPGQILPIPLAVNKQSTAPQALISAAEAGHRRLA